MKLNIIVKILIGILVGILIGSYASMGIIRTLSSVGFVLSQYIKFAIPLLVLAFVTKGVADFGGQASRGLLLGLTLAYTSTILACLLGFTIGGLLLPRMNIVPGSVSQAISIVPFLKIEIPPVMSIMTALVLSIIVGLGITWTGKKTLAAALDEFHTIVNTFMRKGVIPLFPYFVASVFMELTAKGQLIPTAKAFMKVLVVIIPVQWLWLLILYLAAGAYAKKNPFPVLKTMLPAYLTACGTMSSAATLPVELECAHKVPFLKKETVNFCIPLFNITHLCGAAMAITMSAMTVSVLTQGQIPTLGSFLPFILLLGFIEVAAVGVPGGSVTAALGILESVLAFDQTGLGLMVALFMIQDSFGTAANVTGDAALTMIVNEAISADM